MTMRLFWLIWLVASMALMIFGWIRILVYKGDEKKQRSQYIILAVASFMMTAYFIYLLFQ